MKHKLMVTFKDEDEHVDGVPFGPVKVWDISKTAPRLILAVEHWQTLRWAQEMARKINARIERI